MSWHKNQCYIAVVYICGRYAHVKYSELKQGGNLDDISVIGALSDDGLITQTGIVLFFMTFISCKKPWSKTQ